jgi:hypothetical protein
VATFDTAPLGDPRTQEIEKIFQCRITGFWALTTGGLNSVAGYTSLNPVSIAWELVPYSFVADKPPERVLIF